MRAFLALFVAAEVAIKGLLTTLVRRRPERSTLTQAPGRIESVLLALRVRAVGTPNRPGAAWNLVADAYQRSARKAARDARRARSDDGRAELGERHLKSAQGIFASLAERLDSAIAHVGREANEAVRQSVNQRTREGESGEQIATELSEQGVKGFTDKLGRKWTLANYAKMCASVAESEARTQGTINTLTDLGEDLVQVSEHPHPTDICSPYEGRVYSISGDSGRYPKLREAPPFHPNCKHLLLAYTRT